MGFTHPFEKSFNGVVKNISLRFLIPPGDIFAGIWDHNSGEGTVQYSDGSVYEGSWLSGERHGFGALTYNSGAAYVGEYVKGLKEGNGSYTWPDGAKYEGEYRVRAQFR